VILDEVCRGGAERTSGERLTSILRSDPKVALFSFCGRKQEVREAAVKGKRLIDKSSW
jgi:hypothetical protein